MNVRSFLTTGKNGICENERNVISKFISFVEYVNGLFEEEFVFNTGKEKKRMEVGNVLLPWAAALARC